MTLWKNQTWSWLKYFSKSRMFSMWWISSFHLAVWKYTYDIFMYKPQKAVQKFKDSWEKKIWAAKSFFCLGCLCSECSRNIELLKNYPCLIWGFVLCFKLPSLKLGEDCVIYECVDCKVIFYTTKIQFTTQPAVHYNFYSTP